MKKILALIAFLLHTIPSFAANNVATFEVKALYEIQNGKITQTSGEYTQAFSLEQNKICRLYSKDEHQDWNDTEKRCFNFSYIPTLLNKGYYLTLDKGQTANAMIQFSEDFKTMTLYQWNGLDTHCTVWYGKVK